MITGAIPTTGAVNGIFVGDFNKTGKDSVLIIDQGMEDKDASNPGFDGAKNILLLHTGSSLVDASATHLPQDGMNFNHISGMYKKDVPGEQVLALTRLGGPRMSGFGVLLLSNDGTGKFLGSTSQLPKELAYTSQFDNAVDYINAGASTIAELGAAGTPYLVAGTYGETSISKQRAVFVYKLVSGHYTQVAKVAIPTLYKDIPYAQGMSRGLGVSGIIAGNFMGSGRKDLAVLWEGAGISYLQVIRNDGNDMFTDVTASTAVPAITAPYDANSGTPVTFIKPVSLNNDGLEQIHLVLAAGRTLDSIGSWRPILHYKDNTFQFMDIYSGLSSQDLLDKFNLKNWGSGVMIHFETLTNNGTRPDILVRSWATSVSSGPFQLVNDLSFQLLKRN